MGFTVTNLFKDSTKYLSLNSSFLRVGDIIDIAQIGYGTTISKDGVVRGIAICSKEALAYTAAIDKFLEERGDDTPTADEIRQAVKNKPQGKFLWFTSTVLNRYDLEPINRQFTAEEKATIDKDGGIMHKGTLCDLVRDFINSKAKNGNFELKHLDELSRKLTGKKIICQLDFKYKNDRGFRVPFLKYNFKD